MRRIGIAQRETIVRDSGNQDLTPQVFRGSEWVDRAIVISNDSDLALPLGEVAWTLRTGLRRERSKEKDSGDPAAG